MSTLNQLSSPELVKINHVFVHETVLLSQVPNFTTFFKHCNTGVIEGKEFDIMDIEDEVLNAFASWLYTDNLDGVVISQEKPQVAIDLSLELYDFAESLGLSRLQQLCIDLLINATISTKTLPTWNAARYYYQTSREGDPMRQKLADIMAVGFLEDKDADLQGKLKDILLRDQQSTHELISAVLDRAHSINIYGTNDEQIQMLIDCFRQRSALVPA